MNEKRDDKIAVDIETIETNKAQTRQRFSTGNSSLIHLTQSPAKRTEKNMQGKNGKRFEPKNKGKWYETANTKSAVLSLINKRVHS